MSKHYKKKIEKVEEFEDFTADDSGLSKKELYDLNKKKKEELKAKNAKKNEKKKNKNKKKKESGHKASLLARIFAFFMVILMIGSVIASVSAYIR